MILMSKIFAVKTKSLLVLINALRNSMISAEFLRPSKQLNFSNADFKLIENLRRRDFVKWPEAAIDSRQARL